ncbi:MAG: Uma2 family endonuclease [Planctomycetota bacterium]
MFTVPYQMFRINDIHGRMPSELSWDLRQGRLRILEPNGFNHGCVAARIGSALFEYARSEASGTCYAAGTGFVLGREPDTLLAPDAAFVSRQCDIKPTDPNDFLQGPPDLAVEVASFNDEASDLRQKADDYLAAGTQAVWLVWPDTRTVTVLRPGHDQLTLSERETLEGDPVAPGFRLELAELFRR